MPSVIALNCTLKSRKGKETSSTERLLQECLDAFKQEQLSGEIVRIADLNIPAGVSSDEGEGDDWPALRRKILEADVLILGTPIWVGQPSSLAKRVLERMDAFYDEKDAQGRMPSYGKVAVAAVVGNEDGAHYCSALLFQALNDLGFTLPAGAITYWVGEALGSSEYKRLRSAPDEVHDATRTMVQNAAHLARLLTAQPYPAVS